MRWAAPALRLRPARRSGRQPEAAAEASIEVGQVIKTADEGNIADAPMARLRQKIERFSQPQFQKAGAEARACFVQ